MTEMVSARRLPCHYGSGLVLPYSEHFPGRCSSRIIFRERPNRPRGGPVLVIAVADSSFRNRFARTAEILREVSKLWQPVRHSQYHLCVIHMNLRCELQI